MKSIPFGFSYCQLPLLTLTCHKTVFEMEAVVYTHVTAGGFNIGQRFDEGFILTLLLWHLHPLSILRLTELVHWTPMVSIQVSLDSRNPGPLHDIEAWLLTILWPIRGWLSLSRDLCDQSEVKIQTVSDRMRNIQEKVFMQNSNNNSAMKCSTHFSIFF